MTETNGDHQESDPEDLDQPVFSLVTGKYRHAKRYHSMFIGVPTHISILLTMLTTLQIQNPTRPAPTRPRPLLSSAIRTQLSVLCPTVPQVNSSKNVVGEGWRLGLGRMRLVYSNKGEAVLREGMKTTIGRELEPFYWMNVICSCTLVVYR